jgi:hypothetical protein
MTARSQCAQIATFLKKPGARLTSLDALKMFGCLRAAARVEELRRQGMDIKTHMVPVIGGARVAEYSLAKREGA